MRSWLLLLLLLLLVVLLHRHRLLLAFGALERPDRVLRPKPHNKRIRRPAAAHAVTICIWQP